MAHRHDLNSMLRAYTLRHRKPDVGFNQFSVFVQKYVEKLESEGAELDKSIASAVMLGHELESLAAAGGCSLEQENGRIRNIHYPRYYFYETQRLYSRLENSPDQPFPSEKYEKLLIPMEMVIAVDVKKEFSEWINKKEEGYVIRLNFPEGLHSIFCTVTVLNSKMLDFSVQKIRQYLNTHKNAEYMKSKLRGVFPSKDGHVKDLVNAILTQSRQAMTSITSPGNFSYQFWTHLAASILQEYRQKDHMTTLEHSFCQAAYMIGFYNMYYKGQQSREKDRETALKSMREAFLSKPYYFSINDIYAFRDKSGIPIAKRVAIEDINRQLSVLTQPPGQMELAEVVRLNAPGNREFFVPRERIVLLFLKKTHDIRRRFRQEYIDHWAQLLDNFFTSDAMKRDQSFDAEIMNKIRDEEPLFHALLRYDILYIAKETTKPGFEAVKEVEECLGQDRLEPISRILHLEREKILREARLRISWWKSMSLLVHIVKFFKSFSRGVKTGTAAFRQQSGVERTNKQIYAADTAVQKEAPNAFEKPAVSRKKTSKEELRDYKASLDALRIQIARNDDDLDSNLDALESRWNPLLDARARANLREDVNSMIRDFIRRLKRGFQIKPPDARRIDELAARLAQNPAFSQIRKIDDFKTYIKLYILKILYKR